MKALFLDLDHTLIRPLDGRTFPQDEHDWEFVPGIVNAIEPFLEAGTRIIVISNQGGIEAGYHTAEEITEKLRRVMRRLAEELDAEEFIDTFQMTDFYFCPSLQEHPDRKPNPGMILRAAQEHNIDLAESLFVGDMDSDQQAAAAAGVRYLDVNEFLLSPPTP